ncbi:hypothetical protein Rsub_03764 [Raphidocelis subcapitata]|uniref:Tubby C-terminal domain-containing protein n=1 Tax=Raphidocelis subcapitata TaxID=307507 RepID=A0A2V0NUA7_9CHLO|nr:hypothetical protein Rsub_03764 [Raphidocelis subcapitata]|eukprot:GBF90909.1 hypothetical protein Rsub_03764 [Raphidocelis subcapitata]
MSSSRPISGSSRSRLATSSYKSLGLGAADHGDVLAGEASPRTSGGAPAGDLSSPAQAAAARLQQQKSFAAQKRLERLQLGGIAQTNEGLIRSRPGSAGTPTRSGGTPRPVWEEPGGRPGGGGGGGILFADGPAGAQAAAAAPLLPPPMALALGRGTSSMDEAHLYERVAPAGAEPGDAQRQLMARGLAAVYDPTAGAATAGGGGGGRDAAPAKVVVTDAAAFILTPAPREGVVQCVIMREKDGVVGMKNHKYQLFLDDGTRRFLAAARRRKSSAASAYDITTSQSAGAGARYAPGYVGKLRANFVGTEFLLVDAGAKPGAAAGSGDGAAAGGAGAAAAAAAAAGLPPRRELAAVAYEPNILGTKGPRKMLVAVPAAPPAPAAGITSSSSSSSPRAPNPAAPLLDRLKAHAGDPAPQPPAGLLVLRNRTPRWNEAMRAFCLNFGGRVTVASVKNFQLSPDDEPGTPVLLQFGKIGEETFTCDFRWPLTALQAFAICLSSFDSKLACE